MAKEATKEKKQTGQPGKIELVDEKEMQKWALRTGSGPLVKEGAIVSVQPLKPGVYLEVKEEPKEGKIKMQFIGYGASGAKVGVTAKLQVEENTHDGRVEKLRTFSMRAEYESSEFTKNTPLMDWTLFCEWTLSDGKVSLFSEPDNWPKITGEDTIDRNGHIARVKFEGMVPSDGTLWMKNLSFDAVRDWEGVTDGLVKSGAACAANAAKDAAAFYLAAEKLLNKEWRERVRQLELPPKLK